MRRINTDLEDFDEQMHELLSSIQSILERDMVKLKGQERIEVDTLNVEMSIPSK